METIIKKETEEKAILQSFFFPEYGKPSISIQATSLEEARVKLEEIKNKKLPEQK